MGIGNIVICRASGGRKGVSFEMATFGLKTIPLCCKFGCKCHGQQSIVLNFKYRKKQESVPIKASIIQTLARID